MSNLTTFVAGYREVTSTDRKGNPTVSIALIIRDKVGKNPMVRVKAEKTGSVWIDKGFTLEDVKKAYPYGSPVLGYEWGKQVQTEFGGVYKLEPIAEEAEKE